MPTVLIVDDSATARTLTRRCLVAGGQSARRCLEAADGMEALAVLERERPDLVITDLAMPRLDGWGLVDAMHQSPELAGIPVVVISTTAGPQVATEARQHGAVALTGKPISAGAMGFILRLLRTTAEGRP